MYNIEVICLSLKLPAGFELKNISFSLKSGECLCIVGPSGSGKTTLLEAIMNKNFIHNGSIKAKIPDELTVLIPQQNHFKSKSGSSDFYYQQRFESAFSDETPTVMEDILKEVETSHPEIIDTLNQLGISHLQEVNLIKLSSGENKRLQIAKALLKRPKLILLDSPFTGLDQNSQKILLKILGKLKAKQCTLIISNDLANIPKVANKILEIKNGIPHYFGSVENFKPYIEESKLNICKAPEKSSTPLVDLINVNINYGNRSILRNFSWRILSGEKWLLRGHNGAGKSTILSLINADNPQSYSNKIYLFGQRRGSGESIWDIKKQIGFCSPEYHLYFDLEVNVYETLVSGFFDTIGTKKKINDNQNQQIDYWLNLLEVMDYKNWPLRKLSFGQQRLILIGRAMIKKPKLLILDEPCQGLDHIQILKVKEILSIMSENETLIYVSHNDFDVPQIINRKLEIAAGQILA